MSEFKERPETALEKAAYRVKKNTQAPYRTLSVDDYKAFCATMAEWFAGEAPDVWDRHLEANRARKAESDAQAEERAMREKLERKKRR